MNTSVILTQGEVRDILLAVFEYNGRKPVEVRWLDVDGNPLTPFRLEVICEAEPLTVRVTPEIDPLLAKVREMSAVTGLGGPS